jgi:hypothetical protein
MPATRDRRCLDRKQFNVCAGSGSKEGLLTRLCLQWTQFTRTMANGERRNKIASRILRPRKLKREEEMMIRDFILYSLSERYIFGLRPKPTPRYFLGGWSLTLYWHQRTSFGHGANDMVTDQFGIRPVRYLTQRPFDHWLVLRADHLRYPGWKLPMTTRGRRGT